MTFDLFNESTWHSVVSVADLEKRIRNKALGHIGQMISEIRSLRAALQQGTDLASNVDFAAAEYVRNFSPAAFEQMQIQIIYPNDDMANLIRTIDEVLDFWKDKKVREYNWKSILPKLKDLKPYLKDKGQFALYDRSAENLRTLINVKVKGNEAWNLYIKTYRDEQYFRKTCNDKALLDEGPESEDYDDE